MQADRHYQHTLLSKTLAAWKVRENDTLWNLSVCAEMANNKLPCCFTPGAYAPSVQVEWKLL